MSNPTDKLAIAITECERILLNYKYIPRREFLPRYELAKLAVADALLDLLDIPTEPYPEHIDYRRGQ